MICLYLPLVSSYCFGLLSLWLLQGLYLVLKLRHSVCSLGIPGDCEPLPGGSLRPCTPPCSLPVLQVARWVCEKHHFPWSFCSLIDSGHGCFCWRRGLTMYPGWSAIHYRDQAGLKLTKICLSRPSECRPVSTCQALGSFIKQVGLHGAGFLSCFHAGLFIGLRIVLRVLVSCRGSAYCVESSLLFPTKCLTRGRDCQWAISPRSLQAPVS